MSIKKSLTLLFIIFSTFFNCKKDEKPNILLITPLPLTSPSHASILTSLHPITHQLLINGNSLNEKNETIAEDLIKLDFVK